MTIPVSLNTISNLQDTTTAQTNINANSAAITGGFSTALNVTGDQMKGNLDMNSNQILNLPAPATANSPVRLVDVTSSSSIASVPPVGTSGAVVGLLNANLTFSGSDTFTGSVNFTGSTTFPTAYVRQKLQANTTYYVNSSTGNNNNAGTSAGSPWQTIQYAVSFIGANLDLNGYVVTIQLADGTYNESVNLVPYLGRAAQGHAGPILIQGNVATPANVIINSSTGFCFSAVETSHLEYEFSGMTVQGSGGFLCDVGGWIVINSSVVFGACTNQHVVAENGGFIEILSNYTITGGSSLHLYAVSSGQIIISPGITVTVNNTPSFSSFFVAADLGGTLTVASVTFSGSATGTKWFQGRNALIWAGGANLNTLFPGNVNGTAGTLLNEGVSISTGSVIVSGGVFGLPAWSPAPTLNSITLSSAGPSLYSGTGAPTTSAVQGSMYLRSDGSTVSTRMYLNTTGVSTWTAVTTLA